MIKKWKEYKSIYNYDCQLIAATKSVQFPLSKKFKYQYRSELKVLRHFRFAQVNKDNILGKLLNNTILKYDSQKYGISLSYNLKIGKGFVIGHFGRIIINGNAKIGEDFVVSPGVVIGMDMSEKRRGVPNIGNRVCIHSNAVVVGNINIGDDVVIAPNSFVNFDVPSHSVVVGNPGIIHFKEGATDAYIGVVSKGRD